jgi:hypothetical protein
MPPPITPTPVEPCVETEPAYWFRRVGEVSFARPASKRDGGDGDSAAVGPPSSSRRVSAAPTAGLVAFSDGQGEAVGAVGVCVCVCACVLCVCVCVWDRGPGTAVLCATLDSASFLRVHGTSRRARTPALLLSLSLSDARPCPNPPSLAVYLSRTAALLAAAGRVEEGR